MTPEHPTRRAFLKTAGLGVAALALPRPLAAAGAQARRPDVLLIVVDDLNDWVGCLGGHPGVRTPNIDRLARRGVLFTNAHCAAPLCNPSRTSLFTGLRPSTTGVYYNDQPWRRALPDTVTLSQHFMAHGYRALGCGKLYHHLPYAFDAASWQDYFPNQERHPGRCMPLQPMHPNWSPERHVPAGSPFSFGPLGVPDDRMSDWKVADWAARQLRAPPAPGDPPRFVAVGIFRPHLPWFAPRPYFEAYPLDDVTKPLVSEYDLCDVPPIGRRWARRHGDHARLTDHRLWKRAVRAYMACTTFSDACVGRVVDALDASGRGRDTVVVLLGDHGWHLGEKLHWRKFTLWEEATRNPLLVVAPGVARPGGRCARPVSLLDVYPTLTELCGLPARPGLEGESLVPLLRDPDGPRATPALTTYGRGNHSVRSEQWRYIRYCDGTEELYDHAGDAREWHNLAWDPRYDAEKQELARWLPEVSAPQAPGGKRRRCRPGPGRRRG